MDNSRQQLKRHVKKHIPKDWLCELRIAYRILMEAINDCMGRSCDNLRLTILDDYTVKCEVGHHDGLNVFNIIGLNDNGWEAFDEWAESDDDMPIDFLYDKKNRFFIPGFTAVPQFGNFRFGRIC